MNCYQYCADLDRYYYVSTSPLINCVAVSTANDERIVANKLLLCAAETSNNII